MEDTDLIARLYPGEEFGYARNMIEKHPSCMPPIRPRQQWSETHKHRSARESTEPPVAYNLDTLPYLELRFSDVPRTSSGLVFGVDQDTCDIHLPRIPGISRRHFALTYKNKFDDGFDRLIVRDLGSRFGTVVTYDDQGGELRSKFDWIIDGFRATDTTEKIIVQPHENLKFRIVVARHDITSPAYIENVARFRQGAAGTEALFGGLGLQDGLETDRNTGAHTPIENRILLPRGRIAKGGFGVVSHHWNVSTGEEYACKKPAEKRYDQKAWEKEIDIMKRISHKHIVRLCFSEKEPVPLLALEYMPFGNLEDEHRRKLFTPGECLAILHQSLLALAYLHGQPQPIVHRDIKPENILVKHRDPHCNPDYLHIKLSDFGLSKIGSLKTFCGSKTYCPPEVKDGKIPYTKAVDVWSLGVVILRFAYNLPYPGSGIGMRWCKKIVEEVSSWDSEGLINILQCMLVIEARARYSAATCLQETSQLLVPSGDRSATPTPASYAAGYGPAIAYVYPEGQGEEEQETLRILPPEQYLSQYDDCVSGSPLAADPELSPSLDEDSDALYETGRNIRSNAPPPDSTKPKSATASSSKHASDTGRHLSSEGAPSKPSRKKLAKASAPSTSGRQSERNQLGDDAGSVPPVSEQVNYPLTKYTQGLPHPQALEEPEREDAWPSDPSGAPASQNLPEYKLVNSPSFHESWLQDPLHSLGGGSAAAALGQGIPDSSGWATQLEETPRYTDFPDHEDFEPPSRETRKRWTRTSKSSSSSGRHRKRRGHTSVAARSSTHRHYEEPEPEASHHHQEENKEGYRPGLLEVPNWAEFGVSGAGQVCDFGLLDTFADGAAVPTHTQGRREGEWESPWTESEAHMAEALFTIHQDP